MVMPQKNNLQKQHKAEEKVDGKASKLKIGYSTKDLFIPEI